MPDILDILRADNSNAAADMVDATGSPGGAYASDEDEFSITPLDDFEHMRPKAQVRLYPKASWLDALLAQQLTGTQVAEPPRPPISSVNSDDNGLYRMFVGVSP